MPATGPKLSPGTLWGRIVRRTNQALASGALEPIETNQQLVEQGGVRFVVRSVSSLARKARARPVPGTEANPFLPYDEALFVAELSAGHVALLNRFPVIEHHLLIVTRAFEDQETLLTLADLAALWTCLGEIDGLGFYNGGAIAGASRPHKHLQLVPLPLADQGPPVPIETLLEPLRAEPSRADPAARVIPELAFRHAFAWLQGAGDAGDPPGAEAVHRCYRALLDAVGIEALRVGDELRQSAPYNLLLTRTWMLLVPRSSERWRGISVNALGFAGSLFVRDDDELATVRRVGPMSILERVALPA